MCAAIFENSRTRKSIKGVNIKRAEFDLNADDFIKVDPKELIINGYEVNQKTSAVVNITNVSSQLQRINIFSDYKKEFEYIMNKKGSLAPGMSQQVTVVFTPRKYKMYESLIRLESEKGEIVVPIKAFPKLNKNKKELLPRTICFGWCEIGDYRQKFFRLESEIDIFYPFEIVLYNSVEGISVSPMLGKIAPNSFVDIKFEFVPSENKIYEISGKVS